MNKFRYLIIAILLTTAVACEEKKRFDLLPSSQTGITFQNELRETPQLNVFNYLYFYNGGGVAAGDVNGDGLADLYFTSNLDSNKLYLNNGDFKFTDITEKAGVFGKKGWTTGVTMADVNGDGRLDIYVSQLGDYKNIIGRNQLYINLGNDENGVPVFEDQAKAWGLDLKGFSTQAAFFDYDLDGDLDMYMLNHSVHSNGTYGKSDLRTEFHPLAGDKLMRNEGGHFVDVTKESGIYSSALGYGLGITVGDINWDGYPDIYVGNDFHENDYLYINNGDGTFTEALDASIQHTSRFSMGNDVGDFNNDGLPDILSLDMLPENQQMLKTSASEDAYDIYYFKLSFGYNHQFARNTLQLNLGNGHFSEIALLSGVAATDWSWSALFGDYDQDGLQDVFISNGIPKRPNDLDFIKFASNEEIQKKLDNTKLVDQEALELMPSGKVHNYIFKGGEDLTFHNRSGDWIQRDSLISGAMALGDLDGDGDLDLVTNNIDRPATLYINKTNEKAAYLKLRFQYRKKNRFGIGTKVYSYHQGNLQYKELFPSRGFQASSEPMLHFGYGDAQRVDSLKIIWPEGTYQVLKDVEVNQDLLIKPENVKVFDYGSLHPKPTRTFKKLPGNLGLNLVHVEDNYTDFNREKLIPYQISDRGPALALGDLDGDGRMDVFLGGSKFIPPQFHLQRDTAFVPMDFPDIQGDSIRENIAAVITDFDGDRRNDLVVSSGGGDFFGESEALLDAYYIRTDTGFTKVPLPESFQNSSVLRPFDYDGDGDLDLFVGGHTLTGRFGAPAQSHLLENQGGKFVLVEQFEALGKGMVTDALWSDFDGDGQVDLILVGEWMSPRFLKNEKASFREVHDLDLKGLWQSIAAFDIDGDGDLDYLLGNWGTNSKFKASKKYPMKLYFDDFDNNGQTETITAMEKNGKYYSLENLDGLVQQLVFLKKKYTSYKSFAGQTMEEVFGGDMLEAAELLEVNTLESGYLRNQGGSFEFVPFLNELQVAPITTFLVEDFDGDGQEEVLCGGNYFGVKPYHGRLDSFPGALIEKGGGFTLGSSLGLDFTQRSLRHLKILEFGNKNYLLAVFNNDRAQIYTFINDGIPENVQNQIQGSMNTNENQ